IEKTKSFLNSIIENIPSKVFIKDAKDLKFILINKAEEDLIGIPREELLGKGDHDFFPKEQADFFVSKDREVLSQKNIIDIPEEWLKTKEGMRLLSTKKVAIVDAEGNSKYLLGVSEDITDKKIAEQKLKDTLIDLERSNKELEQFAYVASHDLQEPLRMVASFCQLLDKRYKDNLDDQAKSYINYAVDGAKRMQQMVDALLSFARVGKKEARYYFIRFKPSEEGRERSFKRD
ncbi:MAG: PAS domain-containing protein, partial [Candidatus Omnitrophica bacterium]|nr:PAS domain-containing protein [Candidatus Omnitrophota bacterium]